STNLYELTNKSFIPSCESLDFFSAFFKLIDSAIDILEINSLFFLFYYWPMLTSANDVRLPIVANCYKHEKQELKELMTEFEDHCQKFLCDFDFDHQSFLYMNTYLTFLKFCIFKQKVPLSNFFEANVIKDKYPLHTILTNTIQSFWRKIANRKGYEWLKTCYADLAFYQACLLYPVYIEKEQ
ncbi:M protein trans-acting positive regulator, partial [Listeria monocytogenes]|nr:M protein trans-acting positive regulator [Listeria monocytogenes]